jgi:serine phosphatase RsbU (regulator of sigma subunit)
MKNRFFPSRSRLSRKIVFYVFASVIVIETIILIPSYLKREQELLNQLQMVVSAQVDVIAAISSSDELEPEWLPRIHQLQDCSNIVGGSVFTNTGQALTTFGEPPALTFSQATAGQVKYLRSADGMRYDSAWLENDLQRPLVLVLRQDATRVQQELLAFTLRIAGLVVIISIFVTAGAWLALGPIVVAPILRLRVDLLAAGEAISNDQPTPEFHSAATRRHDELGEVIGAFHQMYGQISDAVSKRKKAEAELQKSFRQVAATSQALDSELQKGREMQTHFLPPDLPRRPGWEFSAFFQPARQVSGDFYDLFDLPDDSLGLVIADVCDKGVGAALFMALFRSLIRIFSGQTALEGLVCPMLDEVPASRPPTGDMTNQTSYPNDALKAIQLTNDYIAQNHGDLAMFATIFYGVLVPDSGELTYVNGGHDPLYILRPSGGIRQQLGPTGPAVGVVPNAALDFGTTRLAPGEILFGYTDGVVEARAADGSFYTEKKLTQLLKTGFDSSEQLLKRISTEVRGHIGGAEQFDDITMLAVRRRPGDPRP